jgi:hypothetical protein
MTCNDPECPCLEGAEHRGLVRRAIEQVIWEHAIRTAAQVLDTKYAPGKEWLKNDGHPHSEPARLVWKLYKCTPPRSEWMEEQCG